MNIQEIIARKEDQTFDCKSIQIEPKALAITIVAFANADGGVIAISVSDKTRKTKGGCDSIHGESRISYWYSHGFFTTFLSLITATYHFV